jgi:hypothetical protein
MKKLLLICVTGIFFGTGYSQTWDNSDLQTKIKTDSLGFLQNVNQKNTTAKYPVAWSETNKNQPLSDPAPTIKWKETWNFKGDEDADLCTNLYLDAASGILYSSGLIDESYGIVAFDVSGDSLLWWDKVTSWNGSYPKKPYDMTIDSNGFLITAGISVDAQSGQDGAIVKYDKQQQTPVWIKYIAGDPNLGVADWAYSVDCDNNNDIVATGIIQKYFHNKPHHFFTIYKLMGGNGDTLWKKEYGNISGVGGNAVIDNNNNIYAVGEVIDTNEFYSIIKIASDGQELWRHDDPGIYNAQIVAKDILLTHNADSILYVCGYSHPENSPTGKDFAVAKIDKENGNILWVNAFNGELDSTDIAYHLTTDEQNNVYAAGYVFDNICDSSYRPHIAIARFNGVSGAIEWKHTFDFNNIDSYSNDISEDIVYDDDGYVIVTGYAIVYENNGWPHLEDIFTVKIEAETGNIYWLSLINGDDPQLVATDWGKAVALEPETRDVFVGGMMMELDDNGVADDNYFLARLSYDIVGVQQNKKPNENGKILIGPNPVVNGSQITYSVEEDSYTEINLLNLNGQIVAPVYRGNKKAGTYSFYWQPQGIARGIYLMQIITNHRNMYSKKVVIK